jgi:flagellar protein FliS
MNSNHIARRYRELAIKAATPVGLIILLYEMAIESLAHAMHEIDSGNIEARTADLNHALMIIGELQRSLNIEVGGSVATRLANFYDVARCKILEANIKSSKETLERLSSVLASIRDAWQVVEQETGGYPGGAAASEPPRSSPVLPSQPQQDTDDTPLRWSA